MKAKKAAKRKAHIRNQLALGKVNRYDGVWADPGCLDRKVADRAAIISQRMMSSKNS